MKDRLSLREWIEAYDSGKFDSPDVHTQIDAGWYDWFCKDTSLVNKTRKLAHKVKRVAKSHKIDRDKVYVFFKNNCPCVGKLYDDFRICDLETGDVIFTITPSSGHDVDKGSSEVWSRENNFAGPIVSGKWKNVCDFFGV